MHVRSLLAFAALLSISSPLFAQFSIGIAAGANSGLMEWRLTLPSALSGRIIDDLDLNWRIAIPLEYQFSPALSVRGDVTLQRRWYALSLFDENDNMLGEVLWDVFQSVEMSALASVRPFRRERSLYFLGGVTGSYLQDYWLYDPKTPPQILPGQQRRARAAGRFDGRSRHWILADAGIGYSLPLGSRGRLFAEARFQATINDVISAPTAKMRFFNGLGAVGYMRAL